MFTLATHAKPVSHAAAIAEWSLCDDSIEQGNITADLGSGGVDRR
jgi:hypothetical protein